MNHFGKMICLWLALLAVPTISAQIRPSPAASSDVARAVELMVRLRFDIPTGCEIKIDSRTPSEFTGYDRLLVSLSQDGKSATLNFLISKDNKSLARVESFDLEHNPALSIAIQDRPIRGNPSAQVTVINFDDLECPVCAHMHEILKSEVMKKYGDKVKIVYKDNPLTEIHPWAMHAAIDAGCLAQQNAPAYWSFVDYVHTHGQEVSGGERNLTHSFSVLDRIASDSARTQSVNQPVLLACLRKQHEAPVRQSMREAEGTGLILRQPRS